MKNVTKILTLASLALALSIPSSVQVEASDINGFCGTIVDWTLDNEDQHAAAVPPAGASGKEWNPYRDGAHTEVVNTTMDGHRTGTPPGPNHPDCSPS